MVLLAAAAHVDMSPSTHWDDEREKDRRPRICMSLCQTTGLMPAETLTDSSVMWSCWRTSRCVRNAASFSEKVLLSVQEKDRKLTHSRSALRRSSSMARLMCVQPAARVIRAGDGPVAVLTHCLRKSRIHIGSIQASAIAQRSGGEAQVGPTAVANGEIVWTEESGWTRYLHAYIQCGPEQRDGCEVKELVDQRTPVEILAAVEVGDDVSDDVRRNALWVKGHGRSGRGRGRLYRQRHRWGSQGGGRIQRSEWRVAATRVRSPRPSRGHGEDATATRDLSYT